MLGHYARTISRKRVQGEALFIVVSMQQPLVYTGLEEAMSWRNCSITWHSFSPWHNLSKLSSAHGLSKELLLVVKVVQVVFHVSTSNHSIFEKNLLSAIISTMLSNIEVKVK